MSEDLKLAYERQPDPTMAGHKETTKSRGAEQAEQDGAGTIRLGDMKMSYSEVIARASTGERGERAQTPPLGISSEERDGAEMALVGLAKVDTSRKHPQHELLQQHLPERGSSLPPQDPEAGLEEEDFTLVRTPSGTYEGLSLNSKRGRSAEGELHFYRQIEELQRRIKSMQTQVEIAEEKSERMEQRNSELKKRLDGDETLKDAAALVDHAEKLEDENKMLKEQLRDAQSHIFSLQPYRKDLTPEEVGREYDDLIDSVSDWVTKFMGPLLANPVEGVEEVMGNARKRPSDCARLKRTIHNHPDLVHGCTWPETDEDIVISIIMRYIHDNIFQKILYSSVGNYVQMLSFIESSLQTHVDPKRDLFAVRTWTAEAYHAILASPQFSGVRETRAKDMTGELASLIRVLCKKDQFTLLCQNIEANCIRPAMRLYEKLQVSTHHFYLDIDPYIVWGHGGELEASSEFLNHLRNLDCKNVLQNRRAFNLGKQDPAPTRKELYHNLHNVCSLAPALYMRQIGRKDAIKEPVLVRKQQVLVAWGSQEKQEKFRDSGDRTLVGHLYYAKSTSSSRLDGWTSPFGRWG